MEEDPDAGKKKRIQIRFVIEMYQAGLFVDEEFFCQLLRNILGKSRMRSSIYCYFRPILN